MPATGVRNERLSLVDAFAFVLVCMSAHAGQEVARGDALIQQPIVATIVKRMHV